MLLCTTEGNAEREEQYLELLRSKQVDGALVDGLVLPPDRIARFVKDGFPIVCLDRDIAAKSIPVVQVDNRLGGRLATDYLLGLGHRHIAHVTGAKALQISQDRLAGFRDAQTDPGLRLIVEGDFTEAGGYEATRDLIGSGVDFTAVFAANDLSALGVITALVESGRRVPQDVSVVGFDDLRLSAYTSPPLTTIRQPAFEIAQRATEILIDLTRGKRIRKLRHLLPPELVVRRSAVRRP